MGEGVERELDGGAGAYCGEVKRRGAVDGGVMGILCISSLYKHTMENGIRTEDVSRNGAVCG